MILILLFVLQLAPARADLLYVTDLEGSRAKMERIFRESGFFYLANGRYWLRPGKTYLNGGDATDRYLGSRFVVREHTRLKAGPQGRYVHALGGNRDIKMVRLPAELSPAALSRPPYWTFSTKEEAWDQEAQLPPDRVRRLKFILKETMGSPNAFALRQQELLEENLPATDEDVVESFLDELKPEGAMMQLLRGMRLAFRAHSTLFVHGGVTAENVHFVPGNPHPVKSLDAWISGLNGWYATQLNEALQWRADWQGGPRPAEALVEYPMPGIQQTSKPESVVTGRNTERRTTPLFPPEEVITYLKSQGIHRLIIGHTPIGDSPVTLRTPDGDFEVVFADNSYTQPEENASWIILRGQNYETMEIHGGVNVEGRLIRLRATTHLFEPSVIGRKLSDGTRVIGKEASTRNFITTKMEDFRVTNQRRSLRSVQTSIVPDEPRRASTSVEGPVGYLADAFDPPTQAHRDLILRSLEQRKLHKIYLLVKNTDRLDYRASVVERIDMLKILMADHAAQIEIRGEPFQGEDSFAYELSSRVRGELAVLSPPSESAELHESVRAYIEAHGLYEAANHIDALEKEYKALYQNFLGEMLARVSTMKLEPDLEAPAFSPLQSRGAWLEKFILWTIRKNHLAAGDVGLFADRARATFASKGWEEQFPIVKLKSGVPSGRCIRQLSGDLSAE